jgi:N-acetylmuramoyl-L-alanine amidase
VGILALVFLTSPYLSRPASAATLQTPWTQPAAFDAWKEDGVTYAHATDLFTLLDGTVDMGTFPVDAVVNLRGRTISLFYDSPFARLDGEVFNLALPVRLRDGAPAVPLATMGELIAQILGLDFSWETGAQRLSFTRREGKQAEVHLASDTQGPIQAELKRNGMILNILTGQPVKYEAYRSMDNWLNIIIPRLDIGNLSFNRRPFSKYIWEFKTYHFDESIQISFRLRPSMTRFEHRLATHPDRIEITLIDTAFALDTARSPGILTPLAEEPSDEAVLEPEGVETDPIDVIVVDAGHGGEDLGAVGPRGTKEKDIVLAVARELASLLEKDEAFQVILTRKDDTFIPLQDRAKTANDANADLFISIHANSAPKKSVRGFETFFLAAAKTDEARATAQLENASLRFEKDAEPAAATDLDFILTDLMQNQFLVESASLAEIIQSEMGKIVKTPDRGVNQAGFVVLYHAYMPSVLVETGFVTNKDEEKWLTDRSSQKQIARAIYNSIRTFRAKYEEKL